MKKLTEAFNSVTLTCKEVFQIELEGIPSAGYLWSIESMQGAKLLSQKNVNPDTTGAIGGSIKQVFTFKADKPGEIDITAVYKRPWEKETRKTSIFHIKVE